jgi:hypothetical protein
MAITIEKKASHRFNGSSENKICIGDNTGTSVKEYAVSQQGDDPSMLYDPATEKWYAIGNNSDREDFENGILPGINDTVTGPVGATGSMGDTGVAGSTGLQGPTGVQGVQGDTGIQGEQGDTGLAIQGDTGVQGIQGDTGVQGDQGDTGILGNQGTTGVGSPTVFVSAELTGTGANQDTAHGLGGTPTKILVSVTDDQSGAGFVITEGAHDATNTKTTVTSGTKYKILAIL